MDDHGCLAVIGYGAAVVRNLQDVVGERPGNLRIVLREIVECVRTGNWIRTGCLATGRRGRTRDPIIQIRTRTGAQLYIPIAMAAVGHALGAGPPVRIRGGIPRCRTCSCPDKRGEIERSRYAKFHIHGRNITACGTGVFADASHRDRRAVGRQRNRNRAAGCGSRYAGDGIRYRDRSVFTARACVDDYRRLPCPACKRRISGPSKRITAGAAARSRGPSYISSGKRECGCGSAGHGGWRNIGSGAGTRLGGPCRAPLHYHFGRVGSRARRIRRINHRSQKFLSLQRHAVAFGAVRVFPAEPVARSRIRWKRPARRWSGDHPKIGTRIRAIPPDGKIACVARRTRICRNIRAKRRRKRRVPGCRSSAQRHGKIGQNMDAQSRIRRGSLIIGRPQDRVHIGSPRRRGRIRKYPA